MSEFRLIYGGHDLRLRLGEFTVGRSAGCDLRLDDDGASRLHARLLVSGDSVWVEDMHSRNGVLLNGEPLERSAELSHGDRLQIGNQVLVLMDTARRPQDMKQQRPTAAPDSLVPKGNIYQVLVSVGQTALRRGGREYAEMIGEQLFWSLHAPARGTATPQPGDFRAAARYAGQLAEVTKDPRWSERACEAQNAADLVPVKVEQENDPLLGRTIGGAYRLDELLGAGGMGRVYRGVQVKLKRPVAIKVVHPHFVGHEQAYQRFRAEARAASRLSHPHSVSVIDFGRSDDGVSYLVMELLDGSDLGAVQHAAQPLDLERVVKIVTAVLDALAEAHALDIVHRDLKPENIMLTELQGEMDFVKVVDYGLATIVDTNAEQGITAPGILIGTPRYLSPEQAQGTKSDARADIYALGVILYELLACQTPFVGEEPMKLALAHINQPVPDPNEVGPRKIAAPLVDVCLKALSKSPGDRYQSATEMKTALERAVGVDHAIHCTACGAALPTRRRFCGVCGAALDLDR